jgi:hypothetical protein
VKFLFALYNSGAKGVTLGFAERRAFREAAGRRPTGQAVWIVIVVGPL